MLQQFWSRNYELDYCLNDNTQQPIETETEELTESNSDNDCALATLRSKVKATSGSFEVSDINEQETVTAAKKRKITNETRWRKKKPQYENTIFIGTEDEEPLKTHKSPIIYFKQFFDPNNNQWNKSLFSSNQWKMYKYNFKTRSRRFWGSSFLQVYWSFHNIDCMGIIQQKCLLSVMPLVLTSLNTWNAFCMSATTNLLQRKMMTVMIFCISWDQSLIPSS